MRNKNEDEVKNYKEIEHLFDKQKFDTQIKKNVSKLKRAQEVNIMSTQELKAERTKLKVFSKRLDTDLKGLDKTGL